MPNKRQTRYRFAEAALAGDEAISDSDINGYGAHPDRENVWVNLVQQQEGSGSAIYTWSRWQTGVRGPIDLNFAHQDASVRRLDEVEWDDAAQKKPDDRVTRVWTYLNGNTNALLRFTQVPEH